MEFQKISRVFTFLMITAFMLMSGCASIKNAPLSNDVSAIDTSKESIGFFTVKISNEKNTNYQPELKYAFIWAEENGEEGGEKYSFEVNEAYKSVDETFNEYVVSFQLKPGDYVIRELFAQSGLFPFVGSFAVPLYSAITVPENTTMYLGHIDANVVDRVDDDLLRAGPIIPLIDQSVTGASGGTFMINIEDRFETDEALLKNMFSYMGGVKIENMSLNQWKQPSEEEMN